MRPELKYGDTWQLKTNPDYVVELRRVIAMHGRAASVRARLIKGGTPVTLTIDYEQFFDNYVPWVETAAEAEPEPGPSIEIGSLWTEAASTDPVEVLLLTRRLGFDLVVFHDIRAQNKVVSMRRELFLTRYDESGE